MPNPFSPRLIFLCSLALAVLTAQEVVADEGIEFKTFTNRLEVRVNGQLFTEYHTHDKSRPYCYPLLGPGQKPLTRNWPMKEVPNEERDHPHHKSFWFAHGNVNGIDFWSEAKGAGKIVHRRFNEISPGKKQGTISSQNDWLDESGKRIASDDRLIRFYSSETPRIFDFEVTVHASETDLVFGDTKEGTMAVRVAESMRVVHGKKNGEGHIELSTGIKDAATWGKRGAWCDYYGPVEGKIMGIAIFDHPTNPRHPTWWHVRDYGLFAANQFGVHDFEKKAPGTGDFKISKGGSVTFKYRFVLHEGGTAEAKINDLYQSYSGQKTPAQ